jgi:hypothetical protein
VSKLTLFLPSYFLYFFLLRCLRERTMTRARKRSSWE